MVTNVLTSIFMPAMMDLGRRGGGKGGRGDGKFHGDMDDYYLGEGMRGRQVPTHSERTQCLPLHPVQ